MRADRRQSLADSDNEEQDSKSGMDIENAKGQIGGKDSFPDP